MLRKNFECNDGRSPGSNEIFSPKDLISVYTVLLDLSQMKNRLGLEVMLEYADCYIRIVEARHPQLKKALLASLELTNIEPLYEKILR